MKKKGFQHECRYIGNSATEEKSDIELMVETARPVLRRTWMSHVDLNDLYYVLPYTRKRMYKMAFKDDPHLSYFRSTYCGLQCYYIVYGGKKYIFIDKELLSI